MNNPSGKTAQLPMPGFPPLIVLSFCNLYLLMFFLAALAPHLVSPNSVPVHLIKTMTSDIAQHPGIIITISAEDIISAYGEVVTEKEIYTILKKNSTRSNQVLIKADKRASLSRLTNIWTMCRELGYDQIRIATTVK